MEVVWELSKERASFTQSGYKVNMNRFCGSIEAGEKHVGYWGLDLWERETVGLKLGSLSGKKSAEHMTSKVAESEMVPESGFSTSHEKMTFEDLTPH